MKIADDAARSVVRRYHEAWSTGRFAEAVALLDEGVAVEVPVNGYPDRESFAEALAAFGAMTERVHVLSLLGEGDEAMLLYDMTVRGMGQLRVAEHFTVAAGRIVRLRQIHDTAPIRAAGLGA